jgi:hypothetical protein
MNPHVSGITLGVKDANLDAHYRAYTPGVDYPEHYSTQAVC